MKLEIIRDVKGQPYVGIVVPMTECAKNGLTFTDVLRMASAKITRDRQGDTHGWSYCNHKLLQRNGGSYHITVFNVAECNKDETLLSTAGTVVTDVEYAGIGTLVDDPYTIMTTDQPTTYFIVVGSWSLSALRENRELPVRDLHVTIAFTDKDLFSGRKNTCNLANFYLP